MCFSGSTQWQTAFPHWANAACTAAQSSIFPARRTCSASPALPHQQGQARTLYPKMWLCLGAACHGHHAQPGRRKDVLPQEHLGQVGLAALQLCLRHGEGVGGGSDGSGTRWQPVLSRWPTQHSAAAHGSAGQRELADNRVCLCSPLPVPGGSASPHTSGTLPAAAQPYLAAVWGRLGELMDFSFPQPNSLL